ncbi:hypothetical protein [Halosimplex pelagicum]|uniref:Uncharacterized protein n=1 Tax=Halosimplex pelagicum TaxID=869886 RepID=A0A7D5P722_9EURY|nr:hypothetical protein [Halosimplex pelagicum]QLH82343.1 hypothetical protein HZS54_12275 [Halosimplex pelagicum]
MTDSNSEAEPDRPIEIHATGEARALAYVSEDELEQLEDGEPFWRVVEEIPEFTPGKDWDWAVASQRDERASTDQPVQDSDNNEGGSE